MLFKYGLSSNYPLNLKNMMSHWHMWNILLDVVFYPMSRVCGKFVVLRFGAGERLELSSWRISEVPVTCSQILDVSGHLIGPQTMCWKFAPVSMLALISANTFLTYFPNCTVWRVNFPCYSLGMVPVMKWMKINIWTVMYCKLLYVNLMYFCSRKQGRWGGTRFNWRPVGLCSHKYDPHTPVGWCGTASTIEFVVSWIKEACLQFWGVFADDGLVEISIANRINERK